MEPAIIHSTGIIQQQHCSNTKAPFHRHQASGIKHQAQVTSNNTQRAAIRHQAPFNKHQARSTTSFHQIWHW